MALVFSNIESFVGPAYNDRNRNIIMTERGLNIFLALGAKHDNQIIVSI